MGSLFMLLMLFLGAVSALPQPLGKLHDALRIRSSDGVDVASPQLLPRYHPGRPGKFWYGRPHNNFGDINATPDESLTPPSKGDDNAGYDVVDTAPPSTDLPVPTPKGDNESASPTRKPSSVQPISAPIVGNDKDVASLPTTSSAGKDDYPRPVSCNSLDQFRFTSCQCTSFVAWRLNHNAGIKFDHDYKGVSWGNANNWDDAAREVGLTVDSNPTVGSVAQTDAGILGHVAWVAGVSGDKVHIEEYNFNNNKAYHTRDAPKGKFHYIHFV